MKRVLSLQNVAPRNLVQVGEKVADRLVPLIVGKVMDPDHGNPEAEATLQLERGLVLPNAVALTDPFVNTWRQGRTYFPEASYQAPGEV